MTYLLTGSSDDFSEDLGSDDFTDRVNGKPVAVYHYSISTGVWDATPKNEEDDWLNSFLDSDDEFEL